MNNAKSRQLWADMALLLVALVWGSTFVMVKDAVSTYPVFPFLALRFALATAAILPIAGKRLLKLGWRGWASGALIGVLLFMGYGFQTAGLQSTSASKTGFITGLSVVLVPILAAVVLRKRPRSEAIIGVAVATIGLGLLTLGGDGLADGGMRLAAGDLLVLGCALSFALHIVSTSAFAPRSDPMALTFVQLLTVALLCTTVSLFRAEPFPPPPPATWFAAGFTGLLATAVAFLIQTSMQRFTTPTHTALIFTGEPVFAAIFGVLLANDQMTATLVAGGVLIVAGTLISEMPWSDRTAQVVSRFLSPHYVAVPMLLALGLADKVSWQQGLIWSLGAAIVGIGGPVAAMSRELRRGHISDWHVSERSERLQPVPVIGGILAPGLPLVALWLFDGPKTLMLASACILGLVIVNLAITLFWKISQHVSGVAATATLVTGVLGVGFAPLMLLIPLVAWARVRVGAHTVWQTVAGAATGTGISLAAFAVSRLV